MRSERGPDAILDSLREGQRRLMLGVAATLAFGLMAGLAAFLQTGALAADVAEITAFAFKLDAGREYAHEAFAPPRAAHPMVKLGTYIANPLDASMIRYARVTIQISVTRADYMERYGLNLIRIRAAITALLSGRTVAELGEPGGQEAAREEIRTAIRAEMPKDFLLGVHFTEFVVQ